MKTSTTKCIRIIRISYYVSTSLTELSHSMNDVITFYRSIVSISNYILCIAQVLRDLELETFVYLEEKKYIDLSKECKFAYVPR